MLLVINYSRRNHSSPALNQYTIHGGEPPATKKEKENEFWSIWWVYWYHRNIGKWLWSSGPQASFPGSKLAMNFPCRICELVKFAVCLQPTIAFSNRGNLCIIFFPWQSHQHSLVCFHENADVAASRRTWWWPTLISFVNANDFFAVNR